MFTHIYANYQPQNLQNHQVLRYLLVQFLGTLFFQTQGISQKLQALYRKVAAAGSVSTSNRLKVIMSGIHTGAKTRTPWKWRCWQRQGCSAGRCGRTVRRAARTWYRPERAVRGTLHVHPTRARASVTPCSLQHARPNLGELELPTINKYYNICYWKSECFTTMIFNSLFREIFP